MTNTGCTCCGLEAVSPIADELLAMAAEIAPDLRSAFSDHEAGWADGRESAAERLRDRAVEVRAAVPMHEFMSIGPGSDPERYEAMVCARCASTPWVTATQAMGVNPIRVDVDGDSVVRA